MALHKVADGQAAAASISLSSVGISTDDLVLIHAYRSGSTTAPSNPGGGTWTDISTSNGANTNSRRIGYRIIQAGDNLATISGTWTNATRIQFIALNGYLASGPIGGTGTGGSNTTTLTTPAVTMSVTNGSSWVVAFAGSKSTNANTVTLSSTTDEVSSEGALNLATGRGVTSYASRAYSATVNASANRMDAVEVLADPLTRTAADSLSTLTETATRVATLTQANSDSVSSVTESAERVLSKTRSSSDSISSITEVVVHATTMARTIAEFVVTLVESVGRMATWSRTVADAISTLTESVVRVLTLSRTDSDSASAISDAVAGAVTGGSTTYDRTAADALSESSVGIFDPGIFDSGIFDTGSGGISESIGRAVTAARIGSDSLSSIIEAVEAVVGGIVRTVSDSLSSLTESATRTFTGVRTGADSLSSLAEAVVATIGATITRTIAETLSSLTESSSRTLTRLRTVADSISSISSTISKLQVLGRQVGEDIVTVWDYIFRQIPNIPRDPFGPFEPESNIIIRIDGIDITADVFLADASFESLVSGAIGTATFRVKDAGHVYDFVSGGSLTLDIDGARMWGGYVLQAAKTYAFPVVDTTNDAGVARVWQIEGADYNVLFSTRVIFKASDPTGKLSFTYPAGTYDNTIINDVFDHYLDLSGDGLSRGRVARIGVAILDMPGMNHVGEVAAAGYLWKDMMGAITRVTAGIYYIDPDKVLHYVDPDTVTSIYTLTDQPAATNDVGYQSFTILEDGTNLINDMLLWGASTLSPDYVFSRVQDSASITEHNRWQGSFQTVVSRQSTADMVANTYVYGTPQSLRGGKDDSLTFSARVFEPLFRAGDIVTTVSGVFGFSRPLPIRRMVITFPNPTTAIYDLSLSYNIDPGFDFYEYGGFGIGKQCPDGYYRDNSGKCVPIFPKPPQPPEPGGCDCGITDSLNRTVDGDWGMSDALIPWTFVFGASGADVDGQVGILTDTVAIGGIRAQLLSSLIPQDASLAIQFMFPTSIDGFLDLNVYDGNAIQTIAGYNPNSGGFWYLGSEDNPSPTSGVSFSPTVGVWYNAKLARDYGVGVQTKVWAVGDTEPAWTTQAAPSTDNPVSPRLNVSVFNNGSSFPVKFDNLDILGVNRCTAVQFENFDRMVSGSWGTATPSGYTWGTSGSAIFDVSSGLGMVAVTDHSFPDARAVIDGAGPWSSGFLMTTQFTVTDSNDWQSPDFFMGAVSVGHYDSSVNLYKGGTGTMSVGGANSNGSVSVPGGLIDGATYNLKHDFHRFDSHVRAKVWEVGTTEPDWQIDFDDGAIPFPPDRYSILIHAGTTSVNAVFHYIDFDYEGRPCYCAPPDLTAFSVQALPQIFVINTGLADDVTSLENAPPDWYHLYCGATYRFDYSAFWGPISDNLTCRINSFDGVETIADADMGSDIHGYGTKIYFATVFDIIPGISGSAVDLLFKLVHLGTPGTSSAGSMGSVIVTYVSGPDPRFEGLPGCSPVDPVPANPGSTSSGTLCETLPHTLGGDHWATSWAFFAGSLEVWVNGIAQTGFTQDPTLGEFTLSAPIEANDVLYVCYYANGNP